MSKAGGICAGSFGKGVLAILAQSSDKGVQDLIRRDRAGYLGLFILTVWVPQHAYHWVAIRFTCLVL